MRLFTLRNLGCLAMLFSLVNGMAQCTSTINTFPYIENFETSAAWTSGGPTNSAGTVVNTWAWGTPNKPVINSAGSGQKCWVIGGLTGLTYGTGERSYIKSPCFDFTNLAHPYITFLVFWESEWKYDGALLQYSTNGGTSWQNLGSVNDAVDCLDSNWYNHNPIAGLGSQTLTGTTYPAFTTTQDGWCGNIQSTSGSCQGGNGSGGWVLARHCMSALAGLPSVTFRFAFGAGTTCNTFNGFAIDSVCVREAPANTADFTYSCVNTNTLSFAGITTLCPNAYSWDFGDPGSGASNTSSSITPSHTFSAPGAYSVTFKDSGGCNAAGSITKTIHVIGVTTNVIAPGCTGGGSAIAVVTGSAAPYTYAWNTAPGQSTDTAINLPQGNYTVTVTSAGACSATASASVTSPAGLSHTDVVIPASCGNSNGSVVVHETGGSPGYTFTWSAPAVDSAAINLAPGSYSVTITDQSGCRDSLTAVISNSGSLQANVNPVKEVSCFGGSDGSAYVSVSGATGAVTYQWSNLATTDTVTGLALGSYTVTVSDGGTCSAVLSITITQPNPLTHIIDSIPASCGTNNGAIAVHESGGAPNYNYTWNTFGTGDSITGLIPGLYTLTVMDQNGCRDFASVNIVSVGSLSVAIDQMDISCYGRADGMAIAVSNGTSPFQYLWSNQAVTDTLSNLGAGTYSVSVTDVQHCTGTASVSFAVPDSLYALSTLVADSCSAGAGSITVTVSGGTGPYHYLWSPGTATGAQFASLTAGSYTLVITDSHSCTVNEVYVIGDTCIVDSLVFPTAFSPNGDNQNELYGPVYKGSVTDYQLHIYNRWGQLVFESTDPTKGWDGNYKGAQQPVGVYNYFSTFTEHKQKSLEGTFNLFR